MAFDQFLRDLRKTKAAGSADLTLVYGSCALALEQDGSDVDVLFVVKDDGVKGVMGAEAVRETVLLHDRHGLPVDAEVPFENKLVATKEDCKRSTNLEGFPSLAGARFGLLNLDPLQKDPTFLGSRTMRLRLILNILTTPHIFVAGAASYYQQLVADGKAALARLSLCIAGAGEHTVESLVSLLLRGPNAPFPEGEFYLGYRTDCRLVRRRLQSDIAQGLSLLSERKQLDASRLLQWRCSENGD